MNWVRIVVGGRKMGNHYNVILYTLNTWAFVRNNVAKIISNVVPDLWAATSLDTWQYLHIKRSGSNFCIPDIFSMVIFVSIQGQIYEKAMLQKSTDYLLIN